MLAWVSSCIWGTPVALPRLPQDVVWLILKRAAETHPQLIYNAVGKWPQCLPGLRAVIDQYFLGYKNRSACAWAFRPSRTYDVFMRTPDVTLQLCDYGECRMVKEHVIRKVKELVLEGEESYIGSRGSFFDGSWVYLRVSFFTATFSPWGLGLQHYYYCDQNYGVDETHYYRLGKAERNPLSRSVMIHAERVERIPTGASLYIKK